MFLVFHRDEYLRDTWYEILAMLCAPTYCLFFMILGWNFIKLILAFIGKKDKKYNLILRLIFEFSLIVLSVFLIYASINNALKKPEIKSVDIKIPNLKQDLKIAMLTDIHLDKNLHENFLDKLIVKVNLQSPDMVVIVGDLTDTNPKDLENYISKLNDFNSTYGTFYALGNNE